MSLVTASDGPGMLPTTVPYSVVATTIFATASPSSSLVATAAPEAVAGDSDNTQQATTSSTIMIIVGCIVGILGVAGVITLIWWMRKRALAQQTYRPTDLPQMYPPQPPPKGRPALVTQKSLPEITPATRTERSNTVSSADKDKALPIKPPESVWSPSPPKSPALASVQELANRPRGRTQEEKNQARERSTSVGSYKAPQEFF